MTRLDLDDLPPKAAALLTGAPAGEEIVLVQGGVVVARLVAQGPEPAAAPGPEASPEAHAKEIFDNFRAAIEDEF